MPALESRRDPRHGDGRGATDGSGEVDVQDVELAFLTGAAETIKRFKPNMLIECDNKTIGSLSKLLADIGVAEQYRCRVAGTYTTEQPISAMADLGKKELSAGHIQSNYVLLRT